MPRRQRTPPSGRTPKAQSARKRQPQSKPPTEKATTAGIAISEFKLAKRAADGSPQAVGSNAPRTIIYVHGIGNKPPASVLKCQWDTALFGNRLGDRSRMAYWVNREYYPVPLNETCETGDTIDSKAEPVAIRAAALFAPTRGARSLDDQIKTITDDAKRRAVLRRIGAKMMAGPQEPAATIRARNVRAKVIPLPRAMRDLIAGQLTAIFLEDVHDFLYVKERREAMERSLLDRIRAGGGPFVIIAHSQGTMIAYDLLRQLTKAQCHVPLFVTLGSPLGLEEVKDELRRWSGARGRLPFPACVDKWINIADRLDPVALDYDISNDFAGKIDNSISGWGANEDSPWHPHSGTGYLRNAELRIAVREEVGAAFSQAITPFAVASDLVNDMEDGDDSKRHPTLIQLFEPAREESGKDTPAGDIADAVELKIHELLKSAKASADDAEIEKLRHFIAAKLTRLEVETLRSHFTDLKIGGVWRNAAKRKLIIDSMNTLQVRPANLGYGAAGHDVCWAVLDTGIRADHPHFTEFNNVRMQWDCTKRGAPVEYSPQTKGFGDLDKDGHGTHVAGIIAGRYKSSDGLVLSGMAPKCALCGFKVLDDHGDGQDSWIIKAMDMIARINERTGALVIHGVNLSLGGNFDPSVFGCGYTPLCQELRRLWRQGVLVCLAAGNEGYAVLKGEEEDIQANMALSIGDPANLEEAIAVGSVHKTNPHTYGVSYFSSRGPTADGRRKPDVVAPGERILSARHDWKAPSRRKPERTDLYIEMSGTSMAAPHVSGLLASFISLRREFIGYPDRVKAMLLGSCIDLGRDGFAQGAGMPNLIKMLALN